MAARKVRDASPCHREARTPIHAEGLLLTLEDEHGFRTKLGHAISGMNVNLGALSALENIIRKTTTAPDIEAIDGSSGNRYPHWLVELLWSTTSPTCLIAMARKYLARRSQRVTVPTRRVASDRVP